VRQIGSMEPVAGRAQTPTTPSEGGSVRRFGRGPRLTSLPMPRTSGPRATGCATPTSSAGRLLLSRRPSRYEHPGLSFPLRVRREAGQKPSAREPGDPPAGRSGSSAPAVRLAALNAFYYHVLSHWLRCLRRRSQRHRLTWRNMMRIAERWLPSPKLRHPIPTCGSTS
jgi:hypothetical protein